jgi:hypothetical protein
MVFGVKRFMNIKFHSSLEITAMNARYCATVPALVAISFLGISLSQVAPAFAGSCRSTQTFGAIDFGDCQSTTVVGGSSISIEKYKISQAAQFDVAVAGYNNSFAANIAQWHVTKTRTAWKLKTGELELYSLALNNPGDLTSAEASVALLPTDKAYSKHF